MEQIFVKTGTVEKIHISFSYPACPTLTLDDIDFFVEFSAIGSSETIRFGKGDLIRKLDPTTGRFDYYAAIDTAVLKYGEVRMKITALIPDDDFEEGVRPEVQGCSTNIVICQH